MKQNARPLPESLTRFLAAPQEEAAAPMRYPARRRPPPPVRTGAHFALETALLRGFVYATSALVWLGVLWLFARRLAP